MLESSLSVSGQEGMVLCLMCFRMALGFVSLPEKVHVPDSHVAVLQVCHTDCASCSGQAATRHTRVDHYEHWYTDIQNSANGMLHLTCISSVQLRYLAMLLIFHGKNMYALVVY